MDIIIYIGIGINIIGALLLMIYAAVYHNAFKDAQRLTVKKDHLRAQWLTRRAIGFGLMIGGAIIAIIGCLV